MLNAGAEVAAVGGDGALEDHREDRGAEGAADLLGGPGQHAGVRDLGPSSRGTRTAVTEMVTAPRPTPRTSSQSASSQLLVFGSA